VVVIKEEEHLIVYSVQSFQAFSPLHTEVHAMETALEDLSARSIVHGSIFTDCKQLVEVLTSRQPPLYFD
jgi:hypothetical protein